MGEALGMIETRGLVAMIEAADAMVKAATQKGWLDERRVVTEILTSIQRAGTEIILTYHAKDVARWLKACSTPLELWKERQSISEESNQHSAVSTQPV